MAENRDNLTLVLVGNEEAIRASAAKQNITLDERYEIVNTTQTIEMCDEPAKAIRSKKDSSMVVGLRMLAEGKGDAFVSAGSTGALHVGASLIVRTIKGVKRPALATVIPGGKKPYLLMDCGANVECRAPMLHAFGVMGSAYMNKVMGIAVPDVALVNNGAEESKGTPLYKEAHQLLKADLLVKDGFKDVKKKMDSEEYGGAPLLGTARPVIKAHGSSKAKAIKNAIRQARLCVESDLVGTMTEALAALEQPKPEENA